MITSRGIFSGSCWISGVSSCSARTSYLALISRSPSRRVFSSGLISSDFFGANQRLDYAVLLIDQSGCQHW
jgi:hypothetical protein